MKPKPVFWLLLPVAAFILYPLLLSVASAAEPVNGTVPRIKYTMASGRGWSACENYLKSLNARPAEEGPPLCSLNLKRMRGVQEPKWEELDVISHLPLVHEIEQILGASNINPEPERDFLQWKRQREQRIQGQQQTPRLRRARLAFAPNGPLETVLSYDMDANGCEKEVDHIHRNEPFPKSVGAPNFFLFDEIRQRVRTDLDPSLMESRLFLYHRRPHFIFQYVVLDGTSIVPGKIEDISGVFGSLHLGRLDPTPPAALEAHPNYPPYLDHELCEIRFRAPISLVRHHQ